MGQTNRTISLLLSIGVSTAAIVFAGGCSDTPAPAAANAGVHNEVTDIRPIEPAAPASYQPPLIDNSGTIPTAQQPITSTPSPYTPTAMMSTTPDSSDAASARTVGEKKHTVRKGETLFSIARTTYGSGKAWKKIVAANPGVTPSKLKVGEVLAMP